MMAQHPCAGIKKAAYLVRQRHGVVISDLKLADADVRSSIAAPCRLATAPTEADSSFHHITQAHFSERDTDDTAATGVVGTRELQQ
jgi:hypothetical protein